MIDLDDERAVRAGDPGGMLSVVAALPDQCRQGYALGTAAPNLPAAEGATAIAICGMGGSGIAGEVVRAMFADRLSLPVVLVRASDLPAFCGAGTLVVASSYSGGTAETLACFDRARSRGCRLLVVSSGGRLSASAEDAGAGLVTVPAGLMPRAAFGYLTFGMLGALEAIGLVPSLAGHLTEALRACAALGETLSPSAPASVNEAKQVAAAIGDRVPVVWGAEGLSAVAAGRWRTQLNENAKVPAFSAALPELDHNEVEGWSGRAGSRFALVALRHDAEPPDVARRFPPSIGIAASSGASVREVWARGENDLARLLTLVMLGDFASTYAGIARGVDPTPIEAIARLKRVLAEA